MGAEYDDYRVDAAVGDEVCREIHLTAYGQAALVGIEFGDMEVSAPVEDDLRATDRKGERADRLFAAQHPVITDVGPQRLGGAVESEGVAVHRAATGSGAR